MASTHTCIDTSKHERMHRQLTLIEHEKFSVWEADDGFHTAPGLAGCPSDLRMTLLWTEGENGLSAQPEPTWDLDKQVLKRNHFYFLCKIILA